MGDSDSNLAKTSSHLRSIVAIAIISLFLCGILFPLVVTGAAQLFFPNQANGGLAYLPGNPVPVGSVIAVNSTDYTQPVFFHLRNDSASGFDPDITLMDAQSQIPGISNATGIPASTLQGIVNQNIEGVWWIFGSPYMNAQKVNLLLINEFPKVYANYTA
jgi:potassium-transporting ATPase KdpC subunit